MTGREKWFFHPIFVFIASVLALGASLVLYIYWFVGVSAGISDLVHRFNLDRSQIFEPQTWVVILVLSLLVGLILAGIFIIFLYNRKLLQLYRMQHNFISNFTHEMKTPLTSLHLYLETFLRHELSREERVRYLNFMLRDVKRLEDNASRILNLARIESGSFEKTFVRADLAEAAQKFYDQNAHLFPGTKIAVGNPSGRPCSCDMIPSLFDMLLMNLTTNAMKYNESAMPELKISFLPEKRKLRIRFEDNGIGIEKKEIRKIFRKFYQVGRAENMTAKGSGIGLYLVRQIARIHGGKVVAESGGAGKGSAFTVILPLKSQGA
ncbi:MAG TPA: HAMP domain-containing sensor histidine kinase [Syntrophales bacterium]|nr:HAMP domain-containing sensor histidine kinase [Syntrophales bacterium]HQN77705.1 HAMP domain-containing sensor histidine kinase [Syntrophales bacterium]HQQ28173.1 HAMP domain-containing sensor histidine kinase [Syntrophales bacterium]